MIIPFLHEESSCSISCDGKKCPNIIRTSEEIRKLSEERK